MKKHIKGLLTAGTLFTTSMVGISIINNMISASSTFKDLMHPSSASLYSWKFGDIYYTKQGQGKPLLLIHDLDVASSDKEWTLVVKELQKNYTVYTLDLLGCGRSEKPEITYTNFLYVQLITDFIHKVIKEKTNIVASGLSASFVIMTCLNDSSIIDKMLLISPEDLAILNQVPSKNSKTAKFMIELPIIGTLIYNIITCRSNIELLFTEKYLFNPFSMNASFVDEYYESAHLDRSKGKYLQGSIVGRYVYANVARALKSIDNSIFILSGEEHENIQETIALYQSLNSSIEYELIHKANKLPQLESPEKVIETINYFFLDEEELDESNMYM